MHFRIFNSLDSLADAAADEVEGWLNIPENRTLGLAGGTTPRRAYEMLAGRDLPWSEIHGWMTDERHVPIDHADSNAGMAQRALFDHVAATLHQVPWYEDANAAALDYERHLHRLLGREADDGRPGMVMLGVGEDGHTASLFPGSTALDETDRDYVATLVPGKGWRLTATLGYLSRARRILFLVAGESKAPVIASIFGEESDLPAALVSARARDVVWLIDRPAAALLDDSVLGG